MNRPASIVSLVPSLTELLFDLGLGSKVAGRTRFCIHPEDKVEQARIIGGTKNPRIKKILSMKPDLIIANREENRKEDVEELRKFVEVMVTDINTVDDALITIFDIGERCGVAEKAVELTATIRRELNRAPDEPELTAAYFIWRDPWMTIGNDTYIHSVLDHWSLKNVYGDLKRYPKTTLKELQKRSPNLVMLSSEPYPFKEKHLQEVEEACPGSRIVLVDGEWFSWYGSRMLGSFKKLNTFRKAIS